MLLNSLSLRNFGAYAGPQTLDLTPPSRQQPVILLGAQNGGGKTTIIDALQLVLYGKMARCSNRNGKSYPDFLRSSIHRNSDPSDGASLELEFTHHTDGRSHRYTVTRHWWDTGKTLQQRLDVHRDGKLDEVLTESWAERVDNFLPNRLAHLFFFDAEKIEGFADPDRSAELLSSAIHSLLGIDLVDRLSADLLTLESRKKLSDGARAQELDLETARSARDQAIENRRVQGERCAELRGELDQRTSQLRKMEVTLRAAGGDLFEHRRRLEIDLERAQADLRAAEDELRQVAGDATPLLAVRSLLARVVEQGQSERDAAQSEVLDTLLDDRDRETLSKALECGASPEVIRVLSDTLSRDRESRRSAAVTERYIELGPTGLHAAAELGSQHLDVCRKRCDGLVKRIESLHGVVQTLNRKLAQVPDREAISSLLDERATARALVQQTTALLERATEEHAKSGRLAAECEARYVRVIEQRVKADFATEADRRLVVRAQAVRKSMNSFRRQLLERHLERISDFVLTSFKKLLKKRSLVSGLRIDAGTFRLDLLDGRGRVLPPDRLSAGERQLLAVSILWGLARASGRRLPTVIDTPLGRLDSMHRRHLVERYFPHVGDQVLLLSTDEEIDELQMGHLSKHVGRRYIVTHDDSRDASEIEEGYFF